MKGIKWAFFDSFPSSRMPLIAYPPSGRATIARWSVGGDEKLISRIGGLPDTTFLSVISAGGAGLTAVLVIFFLAPLMRAQQELQGKLVDAVNKQVGVNDEMQKGARERDNQISTMLRQTRIMLKQTSLIIKSMDRNAAAAESQNLKLDSINTATLATGDRMQTVHTELVKVWNEQSDAAGKQAENIKLNSNQRTEEIIGEIHKLASDDGAIKIHADRIIAAFQSLDQKNTSLELDNQILKLAKETLEAKLAEALEPDPHPTDPLALVSTGSLDPAKGDINRNIIDQAAAAQPEAKQ